MLILVQQDYQQWRVMRPDADEPRVFIEVAIVHGDLAEALEKLEQFEAAGVGS